MENLGMMPLPLMPRLKAPSSFVMTASGDISEPAAGMVSTVPTEARSTEITAPFPMLLRLNM